MAQAPIFVSYSRKQFYIAEYLAQALEQKGFSVWLDVQQIQPGVDWQASIDHGLATCQALVLVATRSAYQSAPVQYEVSTARAAGKPIYLAVIEDTPFVAQLRAVATVVDCQANFSAGATLIAGAIQTGIQPKKVYKRAHALSLRMPFGRSKYLQLLCLNLIFLLGTASILLRKQVDVQGTLNASILPFLVLAIIPAALWVVSFAYSLLLLRAFRRQGQVTYLVLELWPALAVFLLPFLYFLLFGLSTQADRVGTTINFGAFFNGALTITDRTSGPTFVWQLVCEFSAFGLYFAFLAFTLRGWLLALAWIPVLIILIPSSLPTFVLALALLLIGGGVVFLSLGGFLNGSDVRYAFGEEWRLEQTAKLLVSSVLRAIRSVPGGKDLPFVVPASLWVAAPGSKGLSSEQRAWGRWLMPGSFPNEAFVRAYQPARSAAAAPTAGRVKSWRLSFVAADVGSAQAVRRILAAYPELHETTSEQADYHLALLSNKTPRRWVDTLAARHPTLICIMISALDFNLLATTLQQHQWVDYRQQRPYQIHNLAKTLAGTAHVLDPTAPENFARTIGPHPFRLVVHALRMGGAVSVVLAAAAQIIAVSDRVALAPLPLIVVSVGVGVWAWLEAWRLLTRNTLLPELLLTWAALIITLGFWVISGEAGTLLPRVVAVHNGTYNSTLVSGLIFLVFFAGLPMLLFLVVAVVELARNSGTFRHWLPRPAWPKWQRTLAVSLWRLDGSLALYLAATLILIATLVVDSPYRYPHFREYDVTPASQTLSTQLNLLDVLAGPDGNVWFEMNSQTQVFLGSIAPDGAAQPRRITLPEPAGCPEDPPSCFSITGLRFGPDHDLWDVATQLFHTTEIERATLAGVVTRFPLPQQDLSSVTFAFDAAGNLWFTSTANALGENQQVWIGRLNLTDSSGSISEYALPAESLPTAIVAGPDGNMWFFDDGAHAIGKITPLGAITEYALPYAGHLAGTAQEEMVLGADHNLWFADPKAGVVGRITSTGKVTTYDDRANTNPRDLLAAPDGSIWFTDDDQQALGHIPPGGQLAFSPLHAPMSIYSSLASGPDGAVWVTLNNQIGRVTPAGAVTLYNVPTLDARATGIVTGADRHLWFVESFPGIIGELIP